MATEVVMPQMGESIAEVTIRKWLKKVGDRVDWDEPLLEISTDKLHVEIPSPAGGVLTEIRFEEGEKVEYNKVIAVIDGNDVPDLREELVQPPSFTLINPESLGTPRGYSHGVLTAPGGRLLFIAGQIAWDEKQRIVSSDLVEQFDRALGNVIAVVTAAGGRPEQIARLVIYVTGKNEYNAHTRAIGERYRALMGRHFPAMVLVEVKSLLDVDAKVEIEAIAVLGA